MYKHRQSAMLGTFLALLWASAAAAQAPQIELELEKLLPQQSRVWIQQLDEMRGVKASSHWMGVVVRPTDALLRKHLRIDGGLVVQHVTQDSPAAEAGIQQDDILLACNDVPVANYKGLMEFLTENKDKEITVRLLREGQEKSLQVSPTERPKGHAQFFQAPEFKFELPPEGLRTAEQWKAWIEKHMKEHGKLPGAFEAEDAQKLRFFHPGVILGKDARVDIDVDIRDLPDGLTVMVIKEGDKPAKIKVKRGDDEWEVTEKDLDKLPADIREHVKKFLQKTPKGGIQLRLGGDAKPVRPLKAVPAPAVPRVQAHAIRIDGGEGNKRIEKKLEEINERLEKIEQALQKLNEK